MINAVKSIAANALLEPFIRAWIDCCRHRQFTVEGGIEYGHLRHGSQHFFDNLDGFQFRLIMEWSEFGNTRNRRLHLRRNERGFGERWPSVDNSVADDINVRRFREYARGTLPQILQTVAN